MCPQDSPQNLYKYNECRKILINAHNLPHNQESILEITMSQVLWELSKTLKLRTCYIPEKEHGQTAHYL